MAPSPENDSSPKAPDKCEKTDKVCVNDTAKENDKDAKTLSNLNDEELKALLDEAINYKNPKDKEGKSKLFKNLLSKAVEDERKNRATSAGGSELVRYYNTTAKRNGGRHGRRKPSSISENMMHGGSLDNLAKEELYEAERRHRTRKNVSARQREGGSLPCNVNSSVAQIGDYKFLEEMRQSKTTKDYTAIDMESVSLLENDSLAQNYQSDAPPVEMAQNNAVQMPAKYTSKATLQVSNVDDAIQMAELEGGHDKKTYDLETLQTKVLHSKYSVYIPTYRMVEEPKKVDENGNALQQNTSTKAKKKKILSDKNVVVLTSENVEGHRSDIINDIPKLVEFIGGVEGGGGCLAKKSSLHSKSKQLHKQHTTDDGAGGSQRGGKKQRAHSTKGKEPRSELKKSNSLGEISTANLGDFAFDAATKNDPKVLLRAVKSGNAERPRERRSWGTVEPPPFPGFSNNTSTEHLESSETWIETKTKKKSKKRRNSVSSGRRVTSGADSGARHSHNRAPSPDLRGKQVSCSVPHSERSNDSSDVDSVHSLPIDGLNTPISYADIAKNGEKLKEKKLTPEKPPDPKPVPTTCAKDRSPESSECGSEARAQVAAPAPVKNSPPDVTNFKCFPAISGKAAVAAGCAKPKNGPSPNGKVGKGARNTGAVQVNANQNDINIQNDLTIIQANEKENIQYNAQRLPPNIPDVQSIEKHFLNNAHYQPSPPSQLAIQDASAPTSPDVSAHPDSPTAAYGACSSSTSSSVSQDTVTNCDSSSAACSLVGGTNGVEDASAEDPPPVVILSGVNNKEVPGLVFGFDINEQLLSEDVCENFMARYVFPKSFESCNTDKLVNYIGLAWESVVNSNENVTYYVDGL